MATSVLLMADTHLPTRAKVLPVELWDAVAGADLVLHAGDWVDEATLDELSARSHALRGVYGNNDGPALRARLPEVDRFEVEGVRFAMIHETGAATGREARMDAAFPDADVLVFGHSHIPWQTTTPDGLLLLNPGSPTDRRRQPARTFMTLEVTDASVHDIRLVAIP